MKKRICYRVVMCDGTWSVRFDHHVGVEKHVTLIDAIDTARVLAETRWKLHGLLSGVLLEAPDGSQIEDEMYG